MKQSLIILLISVCAANAQMWTNVETGAVAPQPERRPADAVNAPAGWFDDPGWQKFDLQQQADWDAQEAAAAEAAAAEARLPVQFANGIAVKDANGHWMQLMPVTNAAPPVMLQVSESPMEAKKHDAMLASNSAVWSAKFEKAKSGTKGQTQDRLSNIESLFGAAP